MSGPLITRRGGHCWFLGGQADGVDGVRAAVAQRVAAGVDVIKIMATGGLMTPGFGVHESQYGPAELRAACEAAHDCGLAVTAHAHGPRGIAESVAAGVDGVEHATFLTADGVELDVGHGGSTRGGGCVRRCHRGLAARGAAAAARRCAPTRAVPGQRRPDAAGRGPRGVQFRRRGRVAKPPDVLPHGVILFASLGFSTVEALAAVTSVAARACGVGSRKGRLAPGFDADILAVAGDPTTDVRALLKVRAVFRRADGFDLCYSSSWRRCTAWSSGASSGGACSSPCPCSCGGCTRRTSSAGASSSNPPSYSHFQFDQPAWIRV